VGIWVGVEMLVVVVAQVVGYAAEVILGVLVLRKVGGTCCDVRCGEAGGWEGEARFGLTGQSASGNCLLRGIKCGKGEAGGYGLRP